MNSVRVSTPEPRTIGPVSQTDIVRFAGAGGDFNPLHHDPAAAEAAGFDQPIAMGQFTAALLAGWLTDWCGVENLRTFEVRFKAPLRIGAELELSGVVVDETGDTTTLDLRAGCGDVTVVTGRAVVAH